MGFIMYSFFYLNSNGCFQVFDLVVLVTAVTDFTLSSFYLHVCALPFKANTFVYLFAISDSLCSFVEV